jgi:hypothetical protein
MARDDDDDDDRGSGAGTMIKGGLYALGAVAAVYWVVLPLFFVGWAIAKSVFFLAALTGAGYVGYRMIAGGGGGSRRALRGRRGQKALGPGRRNRAAAAAATTSTARCASSTPSRSAWTPRSASADVRSRPT